MKDRALQLFLLPKFGVEPSGSEQGFSLLETLAALTILGFSLVVLFQAHSGGVRNVSTALRYSEAHLAAEAVLAETIVALENGQTVPSRGTRNGLGWTLQLSPVSKRWGVPRRKSPWRLHAVKVSVQFDRGRSVTLDTLKLLPVQKGDCCEG